MNAKNKKAKLVIISRIVISLICITFIILYFMDRARETYYYIGNAFLGLIIFSFGIDEGIMKKNKKAYIYLAIGLFISAYSILRIV
ncbi:hypothetical protein SAMN05660297_02920 [Natronincola peptidivorans]|uniref:DUF3953 domain-containing protein n=1 Tax=Natronincola peptidivorans TaxID=426128 RepID=A0A1I0FSH0_9FIRM|nr:hypothetical protein [Natronincola peptidivorans]SET61177.1 hypothetical protein SAMN05660297_02920 [Natronincola peptidivorans]